MDSKKKILLWSQFLRETRLFLEQRGYLEVTTPCLVPAGAFEASIDPLQVPFSGGTAQLHTSPEMAMKVLLADVKKPLFQITPCFRDDPPSPVHRREFTMLEFYLLPGSSQEIATDTCALFEHLVGHPLPWHRTSVEELFLALGLDLNALRNTDTFRTAIETTGLAAVSPDDTWSDLFFRVWLEKVEPNFSVTCPTLVDRYPRVVSPLSQSIAGTVFSERFEIYWHGMELCNGCSELTDAALLKERWKEENTLRRVRGVTPHPFPTELHDALRKGLPSCAGVAVGLDRLFLCWAKEKKEAQGSSLL